jgi:hypothetical protein
MKKEAAFLTKKRRQGEKLSEQYRVLFDSEKDPAVIAKFIEKSSFAMRAPWITAAFLAAIQEGRSDFLRVAFSSALDKKKAGANQTKIRSLMTVIAVDVQRKKGLAVRDAIQRVSDLYRQIEGYSTFDSVYNQYYHGRKMEPEIFVEEENGRRFVAAGPAKIGLSGSYLHQLWETYRKVSPETLPAVQELFACGADTCLAGCWGFTEIEGKTEVKFSVYWPKK